jgi:hypothetical protein
LLLREEAGQRMILETMLSFFEQMVRED